MDRYDWYAKPLNDQSRMEYMDCGMGKSETGKFVLYTDHLVAIAKKDEEIKSWSKNFWGLDKNYDELQKENDTLTARVKELEAALAEKDKRIKELEEVAEFEQGQKESFFIQLEDANKRIRELEAALENITSIPLECSGDYGPEVDACDRMQAIAKAALGEAADGRS